MKSIRIFLLAALLLAVVSSVFSCEGKGGKPEDTDVLPGPAPSETLAGYTSIADLALNGGVLYAADEGLGRVVKIEDGKLAASVDLGEAVHAVALNGDGSALYAAAGGAKGRVYRIRTSDMSVEASADAGHTPSALLCVGETVYTAERFDSTVSAFDANGLTPVCTAKTVREPVALAYANGEIWVAGLLPEGACDPNEAYSCMVAAHRSDTLEEVTRIPLTNGSTVARGITASEDGKTVYIAHTVGRNNVATTHLDRGWVYTNAVSIINAGQRALVATVLIDDIDSGAANPWGIAVSGDLLGTAAAGTGELVTLELPELGNRLDAAGKGKLAEDGIRFRADVANSLNFAYGLKKRISVGPSGIRAVAADGDGFYTANYFSGKVYRIDRETARVSEVIDLSVERELSAEREGEWLWNDASICYQSWLSCASCHPDGRTDALNWDNLNDGIGTPKQARSMLYAFERGRVMATGIRDSAQIGVDAGIRNILFNAGMDEETKRKFDAYIQSLEPVESPFLENGVLSESAQRGKALFEGEAGCVACHADAIYGGDELIENHTQRGNETRGLLVPSLVEVWRTAPYLYDGRAATVHDVLTTYNPTDRDGNSVHGNVNGLTSEQLEDLENFVLSISEKRADPES